MQLEGRNAVLEAIEAGSTIDKVMIAKGVEGSAPGIIAKLRAKNVKLQFVERLVLDKMSETQKHQGFIAITSDFSYVSVEDILAFAASRSEDPFLVILDGITDPHNLGSIIRSCECAGVHGIVLGKNRAVSVTDTVVRVSEGASQHMRISRVTNINDTIRSLKERGVWVIAAESGGEAMYRVNLKGSLALVIGSEGEGVSALTKKLSDAVVSIPMFGKINSLNAGVACGIVLYEAVRQRTQKG